MFMWFDILLKERIEKPFERRDRFQKLEYYTQILLNYLMRSDYKHTLREAKKGEFLSPYKYAHAHNNKGKKTPEEIWGDFDINNPMTWKKSAEYYQVDLDNEETQEYIMNSFAAKGYE